MFASGWDRNGDMEEGIFCVPYVLGHYGLSGLTRRRRVAAGYGNGVAARRGRVR